MLEIDEGRLNEIIEKAAERGAKKALKSVGLSDDYAGVDIRNLRDLLKSWRIVKTTALQTVVKLMTTAFLLALLAGFIVKMKFTGN